MSTRQRKTSAQSPRGQPLSQTHAAEEHLPASRPKKDITKSVSPPLANVSLTTFIYTLVGLAAVFLAVNSLSVLNWKTFGLTGKTAVQHASKGTDAAKSKLYEHASVSGSAPQAQGTSRTSLSVEDRINELADALGMPSGDLASAIAVAVREFVPPASLSSISAAAKETGGTHLVDQLLGEQKNEGAAGAQATDAAAGVGSILDRVVGMDEPPSEEA